MKRKLIVLFTVVLLVVGTVATNLFAYSTTTTQYLGYVHNTHISQTKKAYGRLNASGGVAEMQIRNSNGTTLASKTYPAYPYNNEYVETSCPPYVYRYFYAVALNGEQAWGSQEYGLEAY